MCRSGSDSAAVRVEAIAEAEKKAAGTAAVSVTVDSDSDPECNIITVEAPNGPGLLHSVTSTFRDLGLDVVKAEVDGDATRIFDKFYVKQLSGAKVSAPDELENVQRCLEVVLTARQGTPTTSKRPKVWSGAVM
jgi:UTP:GlnB (protein PII) uridylyltransferase